MLLKYLIANRLLESLQKDSKGLMIVEDASQMLHMLIPALKSDSPKLSQIDIDELANIITTLKLLTNPNFRQSMTKADVGINPNDGPELLKILDLIPRDITADRPKQVKDFVRSVALLSKSQKTKEIEDLKLLFDKNPIVRQKAISELSKFIATIDQLINKLKTK